MLSLVQEEDRECQRARARRRVLLSAKLITTTDEYVVRLRDLSATGARVEGDRLPPIGKDVILKRGGLEAFASIVWCNDVQAGLVFDDPLGEETLLAQANALAAAAPPAPQLYKRPGFTNRRLSAEEMALAENCVRPEGKTAFGK